MAERMMSASEVLTFSLSCSGVRPRATSTLQKASSLARPEKIRGVGVEREERKKE